MQIPERTRTQKLPIKQAGPLGEAASQAPEGDLHPRGPICLSQLGSPSQHPRVCSHSGRCDLFGVIPGSIEQPGGHTPRPHTPPTNTNSSRYNSWRHLSPSSVPGVGWIPQVSRHSHCPCEHYTPANTHTCTHTNTQIHTCRHIDMQTCEHKYACMHTPMCAHTHTHTYACMNTHTHFANFSNQLLPEGR